MGATARKSRGSEKIFAGILYGFVVLNWFCVDLRSFAQLLPEEEGMKSSPRTWLVTLQLKDLFFIFYCSWWFLFMSFSVIWLINLPYFSLVGCFDALIFCFACWDYVGFLFFVEIMVICSSPPPESVDVISHCNLLIRGLFWTIYRNNFHVL